MNLHGLRLFAAVARARSFSRAAETLHISQPAVSKMVREFELQIGQPLLDRSALGGVALTKVGERLMEHARVLFAAEAAAEAELAELSGLRAGTLAVGASTTIATYLLPELLAAFHRSHPAISLTLATANTSEICARLLTREFDITLVEGPPHDATLRAMPWRSDKLVLIAAPFHPIARIGSATLMQLSAETLLLREPGSGTREVVLDALSHAGITPKHTLDVGGTEAAKQMVASGFGLAIVSADAARDQIALGRLVVVPITGLALSRTFYRLDLPGRPANAASSAFDKLLDAQATSKR